MGVYCLVVRSSSPLSIKKKDHSGLLGENLRGDCNEAMLCRSEASDIAEGA